MLATFAASIMYAGLALWIMPLPGGKIPVDLSLWYYNDIMGVPTPIIFVVVVMALSKIIQHSKLGIYIMASGQGEMKAYVSAIPVDRIRFLTYIFAGLCAAIAGLAISANSGGGDARVGLELSLNSLAACVIGGVSLAGGKGDTWGAIFGALFLQLVLTLVLATSIATFEQHFVKGIILLLGTLGSIILTKQMEKVALRQEGARLC
jgi:ribose transport system permease protein